jgi:energy-coupling factor transporter ATP-binding protein EcfA2
MALARRHELLLLDEPTAGLAPHAAVEILVKTEELKNELSKSGPFTIIMVEHNYRFVKDKIGRLIGMREGKIVIDSYSPVNVLENKEEMEKIFFG